MARRPNFVTTVREAWHQLHGVVCIYKPDRMSSSQVRARVITNIVRDLNQLEPQKPRTFVKIERRAGFLTSASTESDEPTLPVAPSYSIIKTENLADSVLASGPSIHLDDIRLGWAHFLGWRTSGVMVFGLNDGNKRIRHFMESRPLSVYQIKAQFGIATDNHWDDGKVWEKTVNPHLTKFQLDKFLASIQSSHQRNMFQYCKVDPTSQTAYELASRGLLRPAAKGPTLIYSIKCIDYKPPDFSLEIHCINESEIYLAKLIHDLGLALKTTAICRQMRCIRFGPFTVEDSLLRKHWSLEYLPAHMLQCSQKLDSLPPTQPIFTTNNTEANSRNKSSN